MSGERHDNMCAHRPATCGKEFSGPTVKGRWVCSILIDGDHAGYARMGVLKHLAEEALSRVGITRGAQHEVQHRTCGIDGAVEVVPVLLDLDIGFIHAVGIVGHVQVWSAPFVEFGGIALDPAKYGRMIDGDASFPQELFDIAIAQSIPEVPADRTEDDISLKVAPLE